MARAPDVTDDVETLPVELAPRAAVQVALKAANLIGDGLYGVDVKQSGNSSSSSKSTTTRRSKQVKKTHLARRIVSAHYERLLIPYRTTQAGSPRMNAPHFLELFEGFGVELEYMIVSRRRWT